MIYQSSCLNTTPLHFPWWGCKFLKHQSDIILKQSLEPGGGGADVSSATAASMVSSTGTGSGSITARGLWENTEQENQYGEEIIGSLSQFLEVHPQIAPPGPELGRVQAGLREVDGPVIESSQYSGSYYHTLSI